MIMFGGVCIFLSDVQDVEKNKDSSAKTEHVTVDLIVNFVGFIGYWILGISTLFEMVLKNSCKICFNV